MKTKKYLLTFVLTVAMLVVGALGIEAQHRHHQSEKNDKPSERKMGNMQGMTMDMAKMMKSPQHKLMAAYMKSMSAFATSLRDQAMKPPAMDVEVARATVAELRHNLDAMEALHQKHMQSMSADMQSKMKMMMEKMDKNGAEMKNQVSALETDVQVDQPDSAQVTAHANALLKHFGMMSKMHGGSKAGKKKMGMKMDMEMDPQMDMKEKM